MLRAPKFSAGENVLCIENPLIHAAKCLQVRLMEDGQFKYFVHYLGWHQRWDEWVFESQVLTYSDENIAKQQAVYKAYRAKLPPFKKKATKLPKSTSISGTDSLPVTFAKSASISGSEQKHTSPQTLSSNGRLTQTHEQLFFKCSIKLPYQLKRRLVDDRHNITKLKMLVNVPAKFTVNDIFDNYIECKRSASGITAEKKLCLLENSKNLKQFFNLMLETQLLYPFEQEQYKQIRQENPDTPLSEIYGGIHLVRFFFQLGIVIKDKRLADRVCAQLFDARVRDFLNFLVEHSSVFFSFEDYDIPSQEYLQMDVGSENMYCGFENVPL